MKKIIAIYDPHLDDGELPKPYKLIKKFVKEFKPDEIILGGDFLDVAALSAWDLQKSRKMEGRRYKKEIARGNLELDYLQKHTKKVTYLEGNHEDRVERYLDKHSEMVGLIEVPDQLHLSLRGIEFVPMNELYKVGKYLYFTHGCYWNAHYAKKTVSEYGCCIVVGHTHRFQVHTIFPKMQNEPWVCYGLGCAGDLNPAWVRNKPRGHLNQFAVCYVSDDGRFNLYPITIIKNSFIWNGKTYKL
jgi:predicted phosphodiesterase